MPIDLFIEDYLFQNYPDLMPYQFISILSLIQEGIHATTDEQILTIAPPAILSKAEKFYREYEECRTQHTPGDEYELLQSFAKQLYLQNYFSLVEDTDFREHSDLIDRLCAEAMVDLPADDAANPADKKMQVFTEAHKGKDINMAVTRFMVEALHYFKKLSDSEIHAIAMQIGLLCADGISPNAEG